MLCNKAFKKVLRNQLFAVWTSRILCFCIDFFFYANAHKCIVFLYAQRQALTNTSLLFKWSLENNGDKEWSKKTSLVCLISLFCFRGSFSVFRKLGAKFHSPLDQRLEGDQICITWTPQKCVVFIMFLYQQYKIINNNNSLANTHNTEKKPVHFLTFP